MFTNLNTLNKKVRFVAKYHFTYKMRFRHGRVWLKHGLRHAFLTVWEELRTQDRVNKLMVW